MQAIFGNQVFVYLIMAILVFSITQGLKWAFVKPWTSKLSNEKVRKAINSIIFFIPYAVGFGLEFLYSVFISKGEFNAMVGFIVGGGGHSVYSLFEIAYGIVTGKIDVNKKFAETDEQQYAENFAFLIAKDKKIDKNDLPAVKSFLEKIK